MTQLTIHNNTPIQENFLGLNAVYHGYANLTDCDGREYSEALCELEADRAADLGLKIARTMYKWYAYDFEKGCWDWENSVDFNRFCAWVKRLQVRGIDVALNTGWNNVGDIMSNSWTGKSPFTVPGDWKASVANYAEWVAETVHQMIEVRGLTNVKYLVMFTEPQSKHTERWFVPGVDNIYQGWYDAVKAADTRLRERGLRHLVKLIGPNEGSTTDPQMMKWVIEKDPDLLDIYSSHDYLTYLYEQTEVPAGCYNAFGADFSGTRIQQKVDLKPLTEYEFSFYIKRRSETIDTCSGYIIYGAFRSDEGVINAGNEPTNRLGIGTTEIIEPASITEEYQTITFRFTTGAEVTDALIGIFFDVKACWSWKFFVTGLSLKEVGEEAELLKDGGLRSFDGWRTVPRDYRNLDADPYELWNVSMDKALEYLPDGADYWFDEYNDSYSRWGNSSEIMSQIPRYNAPLHGTFLAVARLAFLNRGIQSSLQWTLFDQRWPNSHNNSERGRFEDGVHKYGIMPCLKNSKVPYPAYYAVRITGLVGGGAGTKIFKGEAKNGIAISMTEVPDGSVTILAVNYSTRQQEVVIDFEQPIDVMLKRYLYDPNTVKCDENISPLSHDKVLSVHGKLTDTLPAGAVVAYTNR